MDQKPAFPLVAFLWAARSSTSTWTVLPVILMIVGLFRWTAGFWGYSGTTLLLRTMFRFLIRRPGFQSPPMHGDFEAQRHWMEITAHLPLSQWYFHDLEWWGLDYPPLTAYHSWLLGKMYVSIVIIRLPHSDSVDSGTMLNPTWFELHSSRGLDDANLKIYMRSTVLVSEYLLYMPAMVFYLRRSTRLHDINHWESMIALAAILMQPGTILIDHAHFQYNNVMLGFVVLAMTSFAAGWRLWGCVFFVLALAFKQMALYYAPAVFAYLLGTCIFPRPSITRFFSIATVTVTAFTIVFLPLIIGGSVDSWQHESKSTLQPLPIAQHLVVHEKSFYFPALVQILQCIYRVFPFARGLFEDKVANFWCALHTFHKLHRYPTALLQRISLGATLLSILPPCLMLSSQPDRRLLPFGLATTAWGFFLFSFQVHEKSVLLPLLPMTLTLGGLGGLRPRTRAWVAFANILGCWTMFPLLKRDQLRVPYFVLTLLWAWLIGADMPLLSTNPGGYGQVDLLTKCIHGAFYAVMVVWHVLEAFVAPPMAKPDTWIVINVLIGAAGFGLCYLWCLISMVRTTWMISSGSTSRVRPVTRKAKNK